MAYNPNQQQWNNNVNPQASYAPRQQPQTSPQPAYSQQQSQFQQPAYANPAYFQPQQPQQLANQQAQSNYYQQSQPIDAYPNPSHGYGYQPQTYQNSYSSNTGSDFYSQQPPVQTLQDQQPAAQFGNFPLPDFQSNAAAQLGMQFGGAALKQGQEYMNQNISQYVSINQLRYYFNVSNSYVFTKILLLLFPFRQQHWFRLPKRADHNGQIAGYKPPREDLNAPDLYIPVMAYVTYVLLVGMILGAKNEFNPEVLGITSSTAFFVILVEILFLKFGVYLLNVTSEVPILDLIAYTGYKFVGVITTLLVKLVVVRLGLTKMYWVVWTVFAYTMISFGLFTLRSLKYIVIPDATTNTVQTPMRRRRVHFLFVTALVQILFAWLMV
ncbi:hypothetical protein HK096_005324 [Nowakowskiella sp. JEL0078]|nr:hypothetical protein HK096_005324 [Nowakowskiella sp. JEL0078]